MKKVCLFFGLMLAVCVGAYMLFPGMVSDVYLDAAYFVQSAVEKPVQIFGAMEVRDYDEIGAFSEGMAPARIGDRWGYIDRLGNLAIAAKWQEAHAFSDGLARVEGDSGYGYIDRSGNLQIQAKWDKGVDFADGYAWVSKYDFMTSKTDYYILNKKGEKKKIPSDSVTLLEPFSQGLAVAQQGRNVGFINTEGNFEIAASFSQAKSFSHGLAAVCLDGKWGYIDKKGHFVIANVWEEAFSFRDDGQGIVKGRNDSSYRFIGRSGFTKADVKWNVDPSVLGDPQSVDELFRHVRKWSDLADMPVTYAGYSEGLTLVKAADGSMGMLDRSGKMVIDTYADEGNINPWREWSSLDVFSSGLALGEIGNGRAYGYINKRGQRVCEAMYYEATRFDEGLATALYGGNFYHILYTDDVAQEVVSELFDQGEYEKIGNLVSRSAAKCYVWETYNKNDTKQMESFFAKTVERLMKEEAYLAAAEIYSSLHDQDACMNAYLMHAEKRIAAGAYDEARKVLVSGQIRASGMSGDVQKRAQDMLLRIDYFEASALLEGGDYAAAAEAFGALGGYEDAAQRIKEAYYRHGEQLKAQGRMEEAMRMMVKAGDYADAHEQVEAYYLPEVRALTARGEYRKASMALMKIGMPEFMREAYALRSHYLMDERIAWDKYGWKRVIALSADGTPHINNEDQSISYSKLLKEEKDLVAVEVCSDTVFGLRRDGTVFTHNKFYDVSSWTDIVALASGRNFLIGLRADGTAVLAGNAVYGKYDVKDWQDVIAIDCTYEAAYGLRRDGSLIGIGKTGNAISDRNGWHDIVDIAIGTHAAALRADGMILLAIGDQTHQIQAPEGTIAIDTISTNVVCLLEDGSVAAPQSIADIQFEIKDYRNQVALIDGKIFVDSEGNLLADEIEKNFVLDETRAEDRFVPPAVMMGSKEEWLPHAQDLMANGAYRRAMELLAFRRDDPQAKEMYEQAACALADELNAGRDYEGAAALYELLGDDGNAAEMKTGVYYQEAMRLLEEGEKERAVSLFEQAGDYLDAAQQAENIRSEVNAGRYAQVEALRAKGRELEALYTLRRLGDSKSLKEAYAGLYAYPRKKPGFETGSDVDWTLTKKGTIRLGDRLKELYPKIGNMSGFVTAAGNHKMAFGLTAQGELYRASRAQESGWELEATDIAAVDCTAYNWIALRTDGTVLVSWWESLSDYYDIPEGALDLSGWTDIVAVEIYDLYALGLKKDGTVVAKGIGMSEMDVEAWTDIVDITCGRDISAGLRSDGTVVATGSNQKLIRQVEGWTDIVEIAALPSAATVYGVRRDGSVVKAED